MGLDIGLHDAHGVDRRAMRTAVLASGTGAAQRHDQFSQVLGISSLKSSACGKLLITDLPTVMPDHANSLAFSLM